MRVVVGLSGGVDSAVTALLLKQRGHDVVGVHMINWDTVEEGTSSCPRSIDEASATSIAARIAIPLTTVNYVKEYWNEVFTDMLRGYARGRTIVPDIACNRRIKFAHFHRHAIERLGADAIATGHYASTSRGDYGEVEDADGRCRLLRGADPLKDQTFFLCTLKEHQLRRVIFPLGSRTKKEVKAIAEANGLGDIANRPESMGVCFVGKRPDFGAFLDQYITPRPGVVVDAATGTVLGEHAGIHNFTIGKRLHMKTPSHLGYFITGVDAENGVVTAVEGSHEGALFACRFVVSPPEWVAGEPPSTSTSLTCRIQRTHSPIECRLETRGDGLVDVVPRLPLRAVAPGQMCVFYAGAECLGGAEIERVEETLERKDSERRKDEGTNGGERKMMFC